MDCAYRWAQCNHETLQLNPEVDTLNPTTECCLWGISEIPGGKQILQRRTSSFLQFR